MRNVTCRYKLCKNPKHPYVQRDEMICIEKPSGEKVVRWYYHHECHELNTKLQEVKDQDKIEKDELNAVVKEIYGVPDNIQLPPLFWEFMSSFREGNNLYAKKFKKKYKAGIPYSTLTEAYRMSKGSIHWAKMNRRFKFFMDELVYGISIMLSKVYDAHKQIQNKKQNVKRVEAFEGKHVQDIIENREVKYKKKKDENDMSFLLDD